MPWYDDEYFPPSRPRAAKGGIRAQSQRGSFGTNWWAKRWTAVLDGFHLGARMGRGRSYARSGQVLGIEVADGMIAATVLGSRPQPYSVTIRVKSLPKASWAKVAAAASREAVYASKLLAGEMPQKMEGLFRTAGVSLFPERYRDLDTDCSCPDSANPCKHIAAVYYLLGEEFDRDPFLIFQMRGISRDEFLRMLGPAPKVAAATVVEPEPLPAEPAEFWKVRPLTEPPAEEPQPVTEAVLPRRLGKFPFWRGTVDLQQFLDDVYQRAALSADIAGPKS